MRNHLRVLLISALPGIDPACGDVTYTQTLLAHPPDGVTYETYADAINRGALVERGNTKALRRALRERTGRTRELFLNAVTKPVNWVRRRNWLFREPFRFFSVRPGEYDVVHLHVFNARFLGSHPPVVVSNAAPQRSLYEDARGFGTVRTRVLEGSEIALARLLGINLSSYYLPDASRVIAFTRYLKAWYLGRRIVPEDRVDVVPVYLPSAEAVPSPRCPRRVGFVAKDFDAKGGPTLLRAFEAVRVKRPDAELWIAGCEPRLSEAEAAARGIRWVSYVPREQLLGEIMPTFDVFAYPTAFDGQPLVVLEAMARGIPVATSDYQAMPELVDHGRAGLISKVGDAEGLATNVLALLEPETNAIYRRRVREHFEAEYSADVVRGALGAVYASTAGRVVERDEPVPPRSAVRLREERASCV